MRKSVAFIFQLKESLATQILEPLIVMPSNI